MTNNDNERDQDGAWDRATWRGARREAMRRWAELPVERILAAQEEMAELGEAFGGAQSRTSIQESGMSYDTNNDHHEVILAGCNPIPLASYLKALGVLRLVAEQVDPAAKGCWQNERFVISTRLGRHSLCRFFLEEYRPTPILAPWNGGSGFYSGDNQSGIQPIENGAADRFRMLRTSIEIVRTALVRNDMESRPEGEAKTALLSELRAVLPDDALGWLDAAVLLTEDNPKYPPLLGTGGNDGRLDFTNNFMQRLVGLFDPETGTAQQGMESRLDEALFDRAVPELESSAVGQFAPGDAGGPNQSSGFDAKARINPWDFVLMLEGALLFAAAVTRRLGSAGTGALSYPFTVRATGAGSGSAAIGDEGNARAELWAPLWSMPTGLEELKALLAEGRATVGRRPAQNGLDFARAVSRLGVDRGIDAFQRYAFLMRSGKAYFATPLNRVVTRRNPAADLVDELEQSNWLNRFRGLARGQHATNRAISLVRRLEDAIFDLALARDNPAAPTERLLILLGEAQRYLARSPAAREKCPPVPSLSAQWLNQIEAEGGLEAPLAAALAGLHARGPVGDDGQPGPFRMPMRIHLAPETGSRYPAWVENAGHVVTWGQRTLVDNLGATLQRRLLEADRLNVGDKPLSPVRMAPIAAVAAWLEHGIDEQRLAVLLPGLMLVRIPGGARVAGERSVPLPMAYRLLKPFFCTNQQLHRSEILPEDRRLPLRADLVRRLAANEVQGAIDHGFRQLRAAGVEIQFPHIDAGASDGRRLLASLLVPISDFEIQRLLPRSVRRESESEQPEGASS